MNKSGNPFFWGFREQRAIETLAQQGKAKYNEPQETKEQKTALENYFEQNISQSPNPAFITGFTPIDPMPYTVLPKGGNSSQDECVEEEKNTQDQTEASVQV